MEDQTFHLSNQIVGDITMPFVLKNGDQFEELLKKAQQDSAELQKDLKRLSEFQPMFKLDHSN